MRLHIRRTPKKWYKKGKIRVLDAQKNNPQKSLAPPPPSGLPSLVDWPDWVILEVRGEKSGEMCDCNCNLVNVMFDL